MKTERRHELRTNELADWLGRGFEKIQPYNTTILAVVVAVAVLSAVGLYYRDRARQRAELAWDDYNSAMIEGDAKSLAEVGQKHPTIPAGQWALLSAANQHLATGVAQLFNDKAEANRELDLAVEQFTQLRNQSGLNDDVAARATFGLASAKEARAKLDEAEKLYQEIAQRWPDGVLATKARQRLAELKQPQTKQFYDWFARQETKRPSKQPGLPGSKPDFNDQNLPSDESSLNLDLDQILKTPLKGDAESPTVPTKNAPSKDAHSAEKPDASAPADKPAGDKSAPPATEAPKDEAPKKVTQSEKPAAPRAETPKADETPATPK